jgi:outer membrane protein assembly factor BamB
VSPELITKWTAELGGKLSSVVVAQDRVLVSAIDQHTLYCLDAASGESQWRFTAGGPIDSPPTVSGGTVVFGSRDGHVYALSVSDGRLAWSYRGGTVDRRIVSGGRLESVWPIHGSVLILDDIVYFAAGRSSFLDGGISLYGLDIRTGMKRYEALAKSTPVSRNQSGALPDVLISDGNTISMRQLTFDKQLDLRKGRSPLGFSAATGLLEDVWGHRLTWRLGSAAGKLMVFDDDRVYGAQSGYTGWKKDKANWPPTHTGHLHQKYSRYRPEWFPLGNRLFCQARSAARNARRGDSGQTGENAWKQDLAIQVRAMVLAGETLFAAGWPDAVTILDQSDSDAIESPRLWAFAAADGSLVAEYPLEAPPVFDGAAAAYGRLFVSMQNGNVICFAEK